MQKLVSVVDSLMPHTHDREKIKLLNQLKTSIGKHYMIKFTMEPIANYQEELLALCDSFRREDGQYSYQGYLTSLSGLIPALKNRYYALVLTCKTVETITADYKILEFSKEE